MGKNWMHVKREVGQTLILFMVALPLFFALMALVVDGGNILVHRRNVQVAADASALAIAQSVDLAAHSCDSACSDQGQIYAEKNGIKVSATNPSWHACSDADHAHPSDTNCWAYPYVDTAGVSHNDLVEVRLRVPVATFFVGVADALLNGGGATTFNVSARAVASTSAVTTIGPPSTSTQIVTGTTQYNTTTVSVPGEGDFAFEASVGCSAVVINNGNDDFQAGGLWSNGGVNSSSAPPNLNKANDIKVTRPTSSSDPRFCAYQGFSSPTSPQIVTPRLDGGDTTTLTAPASAGATTITVASVANYASPNIIIVGSGSSAEIAKVSSVNGTNKTITLANALSSAHSSGSLVTNPTHTPGVGAVVTANAAAGATTVTVNHATGFLANQQIFIDSGANAEIRTISSVSGNTITLTAGLASGHSSGTSLTNADWPLALPNLPFATSSCTSGNVTVDTTWLIAHPASTYCFTGDIKFNNSFSGYTFISLSNSNQAIGATNNGLTFTAPGGSNAKDNVLFYAPSGDVNFTGSVQVTGQTFAPSGNITLPGAGNTNEGFTQAQTLTLTGNGNKYLGSGPGGVPTTSVSTQTIIVPDVTNTTTVPGQTTTSGTTLALKE